MPEHSVLLVLKAVGLGSEELGLCRVSDARTLSFDMADLSQTHLDSLTSFTTIRLLRQLLFEVALGSISFQAHY